MEETLSTSAQWCQPDFRASDTKHQGLSPPKFSVYESADDPHQLAYSYILYVYINLNLSSALERDLANNKQFNWSVNKACMSSKGNKRCSDEQGI